MAAAESYQNSKPGLAGADQPAAGGAAIPVSDVDPFSTEFFEDPHRIHDVLREAGPVIWLSRWNVFAVARYDEVHAVFNDPEVFCSRRGVGLSDFAKEEPWRPKSLILEADPPDHTRARAILNKVLSVGVMRSLRDEFQAKADLMVDDLLDRGSFDAIPDLTEAFPMSVFPDAVGLKNEGRDHLLPYAALAFNAFGPDNELRRRALAEAGPHVAWVTRQCERDNLRDDGFGAAIHGAADRGEIEPQNATLLVRSLLTAGIDTTVNGLGAAVWALASFPDQWRRLRADPTLARASFEEAVRLESPVQTFFRTTTRPVELSGFAIGEGQKVLMFMGAANRDPRRWQEPDRYDITRRTSGHVGFGSGIHMCVGQFVARLEGEVVLSALARKVASIDITGPVKRRYNNTLRGLESLPVTLKAA